MKIILFFLGFIAQFSPLVLFFVFFKRINKIIELRVVFLYVLASLISDLLLGAFDKHASIIISSFAIIEYTFFAAFFYFSIRSKKFKTFILVISALNLTFEFLLFYFNKTNFDFWATLITTILILTYCIFFFYEELNTLQPIVIYQSYSFWVATACLIYVSGTLFLFLYTSDLKDKQKSTWWFINVAFEIIKNIFFSIAFIIGAYNKKSITPAYYDDDTNMFEKPF